MYTNRRLGVMRAASALPTNQEIDFDCVCVACVRASERSCVSARESRSVARARQRNLSVRPSVPRRARSELKVRAVRASTDDMRSL